MRHKRQKSFFAKYQFFIVMAGLVIIYMFINSNYSQYPARQKSAIPLVNQDFTLERKVAEVASKFACSCGSCADEALDKCTCNVAMQEKAFIRNELKSGKSVSQVINYVKSRYGRRKGDSAKESAAGPIDLNSLARTENDIFSRLSTTSSTDLNKIATASDREKILSHFECPCGQCDILELRDCDCIHPNGATEVKLFVDSQIEHGKFSVRNLVDMVEKSYGHKIR